MAVSSHVQVHMFVLIILLTLCRHWLFISLVSMNYLQYTIGQLVLQWSGFVWYVDDIQYNVYVYKDTHTGVLRCSCRVAGLSECKSKIIQGNDERTRCGGRGCRWSSPWWPPCSGWTLSRIPGLHCRAYHNLLWGQVQTVSEDISTNYIYQMITILF
jgi:hypothetical protein